MAAQFIRPPPLLDSGHPDRRAASGPIPHYGVAAQEAIGNNRRKAVQVRNVINRYGPKRTAQKLITHPVYRVATVRDRKGLADLQALAERFQILLGNLKLGNGARAIA